MSIETRHRDFVAANGPIAVGIVGAGYVGAGLVHLLDRLDGFRPAVLVNRTVERAIEAFVASGHDRAGIAVASSLDELTTAVEARRPAVVADADLVIALDQLDVLVEATGALDYGARVVLDAVSAGRSVVSINAEVDATIGWLLHRTAVEHGGVYTMCDGDQPGVLLRTLDHVRLMGFEPLVAVNCKRHLDIRQDPESSAPFAARDGTSALVTTAAGDGTKMNVENAVVANLSGMPPDCRGMHGVPTTLEHALPDVLGAISATHVVDYTLGGDFGAGVFVIGRPPDPAFVQRALRFFKMGDGPDYLFFRPYTMVQFEMPLSIAEVVLDRAPLWSPAQPPVADVIAIAKHDLAAGVDLDGIGGYHCYGQIDTITGASGMLPIALAEHARLTRAVRSDEPIPLDAVDLDDSAAIVQLRAEQDNLLTAHASAG